MQSAFKIADRIVMLYESHLVFDGTPTEIKASKDPIITHFVQGKATAKELGSLTISIPE
jgi:phospholipid/cholesterol/gamma-HCH transport system ATP-binding protein